MSLDAAHPRSFCIIYNDFVGATGNFMTFSLMNSMTLFLAINFRSGAVKGALICPHNEMSLPPPIFLKIRPSRYVSASRIRCSSFLAFDPALSSVLLHVRMTFLICCSAHFLCRGKSNQVKIACPRCHIAGARALRSFPLFSAVRASLPPALAREYFCASRTIFYGH
ncbi:hypothetical protein MPTK2_3g05900 [Marchantia polymorpha subsp. ruderalis]